MAYINGTEINETILYGDDGFSPTIDVNKEDGVSTLTITDINGTKTVQIYDGERGEQGEKGDGVILVDDISSIAEEGVFNVGGDIFISNRIDNPTELITLGDVGSKLVNPSSGLYFTNLIDAETEQYDIGSLITLGFSNYPDVTYEIKLECQNEDADTGYRTEYSIYGSRIAIVNSAINGADTFIDLETTFPDNEMTDVGDVTILAITELGKTYLRVLKELEIGKIATEDYVNTAISDVMSADDGNSGDNRYELIDEITLEEDVNVVTITQTKDGEALSEFKDFFIMFVGTFASASGGRLRCYSGASMFFCDVGASPAVSTNYGWFIEINTIGECYDVPNAADYILRKSIWSSGLIGGFNINNSIHSQGLSTKIGTNNTIQALQKVYSSLNSLTVESTLSPFAAGASFKIFARR